LSSHGRAAGIVWVRDLHHDVYPKRVRSLRPRGARVLRFLATRLSLFGVFPFRDAAQAYQDIASQLPSGAFKI
jgi:hypothetical protein